MSVNQGFLATPLIAGERAMKDVLEKFFAVHASVQPATREFRARFLPSGKLLSHEEARRLTEGIFFGYYRGGYPFADKGFPHEKVLSAVTHVAEELMTFYPWQTTDSVCLYLFSGKPPPVEVVRCVNGGGATAHEGTIEFMSFASEQTILNAFRRYRT